jgi:fatty acid desaturase
MADGTPSEDTSSDPYRNPLERSKPLGGPTGVAIVSIVPLLAVALFLIFGFLGFWTWSWLFFLLIPAVGIVVYGMRGGGPR